jgi:hypothetical protein
MSYWTYSTMLRLLAITSSRFSLRIETVCSPRFLRSESTSRPAFLKREIRSDILRACFAFYLKVEVEVRATPTIGLKVLADAWRLFLETVVGSRFFIRVVWQPIDQ